MARQMGDMVWYVRVGTSEEWITCPDCLGRKYLTVIMGDGTEVSIDCEGCHVGYNPPSGAIKKYTHNIPLIFHLPIVGMNTMRIGIEYHLGNVDGQSSYYCCMETEVFDTREDAEVRATELMKEQQAEEEARLLRKEKPTKTWSWNATYHRGCIRKMEKDIEYHRKKLSAAMEHAKDKA